MKKLIFHIFIFSLLSKLTAQEIIIDRKDSYLFSAISENYTLILTAIIDDCGEFGGHKETIELKKVNEKFSAEISIFDKNCDGTWNLEKMKKINSEIYPVSKNAAPLL